MAQLTAHRIYGSGLLLPSLIFNLKLRFEGRNSRAGSLYLGIQQLLKLLPFKALVKALLTSPALCLAPGEDAEGDQNGQPAAPTQNLAPQPTAPQQLPPGWKILFIDF
jgi:hypothetical protein